MNFNFDNARELMVENQLRPNKINDPKILDLFKNTKKENFLDNNIKELSYSDNDIHIYDNRGYLKNLHIAQLINSANIKKNHKILHIGGMTGYVSSLLCQLCNQLIILENNENMINDINKNLNELNIINFKLINAKFEEGFLDLAPYNIIFIDNPIKSTPITLMKQIDQNGGVIIMIKKINNFLSKAYRVINNNNNFMDEYLFDVFTQYQLYKDKEEFIF